VLGRLDHGIPAGRRWRLLCGCVGHIVGDGDIRVLSSPKFFPGQLDVFQNVSLCGSQYLSEHKEPPMTAVGYARVSRLGKTSECSLRNSKAATRCSRRSVQASMQDVPS
jgi:hypothetical protein